MLLPCSQIPLQHLLLVKRI
jgi:hypothetical protein